MQDKVGVNEADTAGDEKRHEIGSLPSTAGSGTKVNDFKSFVMERRLK
jgi:hypothetical protein